MERRGSLRSGEMSQGSCKAGRGWDAQTAGDRLRGSSSVASRDRRSGRALHGRRLGRFPKKRWRRENSTGCTERLQVDRHWTNTGQTQTAAGAQSKQRSSSDNQRL